jgi:GrpB-like predicted nucleotidyltransferase (UPF0157 family)
VPTPDEITRHHEEGDVVYVGSHPTGYVVRIEEPDPAWAQRYEVLEAGIREALGDRVLAIQHIGSTSVPGLPAKPIIDIDLAVTDPTDETAYVPDLEPLGYVHWLTEPDWHQHRLLKMLTEPRVHLHVFGPAGRARDLRADVRGGRSGQPWWERRQHLTRPCLAGSGRARVS